MPDLTTLLETTAMVTPMAPLARARLAARVCSAMVRVMASTSARPERAAAANRPRSPR